MATKRDGFGHEKPGEGDTNDWITPKWVIDALGGCEAFDLDPCSSRTQPWMCARTNMTEDMDGFNAQWFGNVWLNPPYGPHTAKWVEKLVRHGTGIALIFARTETSLWQDEIFSTATGFLFPRRRISFYRPDGTPSQSAGAPSALIAWGNEMCARLIRSVANETIPGYFLPRAIGMADARGLLFPTLVMKQCSYDPTSLAGQPIGMFHCPECGEMVLAGVPHP